MRQPRGTGPGEPGPCKAPLPPPASQAQLGARGAQSPLPLTPAPRTGVTLQSTFQGWARRGGDRALIRKGERNLQIRGQRGAPWLSPFRTFVRTHPPSGQGAPLPPGSEWFHHRCRPLEELRGSWGRGPSPRRRSGARPCPRHTVPLPSAELPCRSQAWLGGKLGIQRDDSFASFSQRSREPDFRPVSLAPPWGGGGDGQRHHPLLPAEPARPAPSLSGLFSNILALSLPPRCLHRDSPPTSRAPRTGS